MATGIINFLRRPQSFFLFINIGDNQFEGQLLEIQIFATIEEAEEYIDKRCDSLVMGGYKVVKVKTDINQLTESFIKLFSGGREDIVDLQRYRIRDSDDARKSKTIFFQTMYIFEVKI